ncbi:hypothetical protein [Gordonia sp. NPDC003585]|uniref:hypothetical protein n=1 Tax=Gordonia sp. NPDC003585 TaxID=3154275 RepID=UPI0033B58993
MAAAYQRTTTHADLTDLAPGMATALREHAESHQLQITDDLPAWITRSINPPSTTFFGKLFGRRANAVDPDSEHQTLVVLHPTHLIVVVSGAQRGTSALSVPLARASMQQLGPTSDDGFSVTGFGADAQPGSLHIGVGAPDGTACQEAVRAAIVGAKNP